MVLDDDASLEREPREEPAEDDDPAVPVAEGDVDERVLEPDVPEVDEPELD